MGTEAILIGLAATSMGLSAYSASKKPSKPTPVAQGTPFTDKKPERDKPKSRKYRPAAQVFADEDLRLGIAGRLG